MISLNTELKLLSKNSKSKEILAFDMFNYLAILCKI